MNRTMAECRGESSPNGVGTVGIFQPITHPMLRSLVPVKVSQFQRERERYDIEVTEKEGSTFFNEGELQCISRYRVASSDARSQLSRQGKKLPHWHPVKLRNGSRDW